MHVFYAQGGGLGHLTRIDKIVKTLELSKREVIIITPSHFTQYFKGYWFVGLHWKSHQYDWSKTIEGVILKHEITSFYVDTFPFGLKGELSIVYSKFPKLNYIYIARILKWEKYQKATFRFSTIRFKNTLFLEVLYDSHLDWIVDHSEIITPFYIEQHAIEAVALTNEPYVLVVHSGGKNDVLELCNRAISDFENQLECQIIVCTQVDLELIHPRVSIQTNKYPVTQYFEDAVHIYTAGGFNSVQELQDFKHKHTAVAFDKLFDDQEFRLLKRRML